MDRRQNLLTFEDVSLGYSFVAATDYTTASEKIAAKAGHTIFIVQITLAVTTDNAARQRFQDDATTPIVAAESKASPGIGPITWDFGDTGFPLTEGKGLTHQMTAAGMAGSVTITAYRRRTTGVQVPVPPA